MLGCEREQLERELRGRAYQALLVTLREEEPFLHRFKAWAEVTAFIADGGGRDGQKDVVLRPILRAHRADADPRWLTILLGIFWPRLEWIHRLKRRWDRDANELSSNLTWVFMQVVCRIDVDHRPHRLTQKVVNDTIHRLHDEYRREWDRSHREVLTDPEKLQDIPGGSEGIGLTEAELREAENAAIRRLRGHQAEGRLSEADFFLLVGTFVYGRSLAEYAREVGLPYEAAKKRRQRALATIRRHEACG